MAFILVASSPSAQSQSDSIASVLEERGYDVERANDFNHIGQYFLGMRRYIREHKTILICQPWTIKAMIPDLVVMHPGEERQMLSPREFLTKWLPAHTHTKE